MAKWIIEFKSELFFKDLGDGKRVRLIRDFHVIINGIHGIVPKKFISDLASVPWLFRRVFPRFGPWNKAAVLHDWIYASARWGILALERKDCDEIFLRAIKASHNCSGFKAGTMFLGVKLGGYGPWYAHRTGRDKANPNIKELIETADTFAKQQAVLGALTQ